MGVAPQKTHSVSPLRLMLHQKDPRFWLNAGYVYSPVVSFAGSARAGPPQVCVGQHLPVAILPLHYQGIILLGDAKLFGHWYVGWEEGHGWVR